MSADKQLQDKYSKLLSFLDEKSKRLVLAADAESQKQLYGMINNRQD